MRTAPQGVRAIMSRVKLPFRESGRDNVSACTTGRVLMLPLPSSPIFPACIRLQRVYACAASIPEPVSLYTCIRSKIPTEARCSCEAAFAIRREAPGEMFIETFEPFFL